MPVTLSRSSVSSASRTVTVGLMFVTALVVDEPIEVQRKEEEEECWGTKEDETNPITATLQTKTRMARLDIQMTS